MNGAIRPVGPPRAPGAAAFADSRLEWRRLLAEGGGTFFLVLVAAGAGVVNAVSHGQVGRADGRDRARDHGAGPDLHHRGDLRRAPEPGGHGGVRGPRPFPLAAGSRLLPGAGRRGGAGGRAAAIPVRRRRRPGRDGAGAGDRGRDRPGHGDRADVRPGDRYPRDRIRCRNVGHNAAIAVGGYVALAGLWASPVSGVSMNPARSLGPALVSGDLRSTCGSTWRGRWPAGCSPSRWRGRCAVLPHPRLIKPPRDLPTATGQVPARRPTGEPRQDLRV